ncbi:hypothetical protein Prubr_20610 [Polymorphospora rubra]|uniref:Uncharacterized protein n=1 Tax=Polymorphospora rubra TaxID=338584 RepID=A0A810MWV4_9ACTN|nr:hypothetical protein Prubr_20610 [Polymorphospora rubra]
MIVTESVVHERVSKPLVETLRQLECGAPKPVLQRDITFVDIISTRIVHARSLIAITQNQQERDRNRNGEQQRKDGQGRPLLFLKSTSHPAPYDKSTDLPNPGITRSQRRFC